MNSKKEPLFRISKRSDITKKKAFTIRAIAILASLIFCALVTMMLTGDNPISIYVTIVKGAFGTARKTWVTLQNMSILLLIALALTPAFKMRFWNIGGEGQVLIGGLAAAACMIYLPGKMSNGFILLCMIITSIGAGAIWGFIPAFCKAKWNTNETLATLPLRPHL